MRILSLPSHVDIVAVGVMQELQNIRKPRLQELAAGVPQTLLHQGLSLLYRNTPDLSSVGRSGQQNTKIPSSTCPCGTLLAALTIYLQAKV